MKLCERSRVVWNRDLVGKIEFELVENPKAGMARSEEVV
jgi:hypothetical protein